MTIITEPGIYDLAPEDYHRDPIPGGSLSQSMAKILLQDGGPALFRHRMEAGSEHKPAFDMGTAAHALVLGKGSERLVIVKADSWRSRFAMESREQAYREGKMPLLASQMKVAEDMAEALSKHSLAVESLTGQAEMALFCQHSSGLWLRGQADMIADGWIADYKTTADASFEGFSRSAWKFRYHMQAAWYRRVYRWITGKSTGFRIVAQEKTAPYLVSVWEPTRELIEAGERDMDEAIDIFLRCSEADLWPGYASDIQPLMPPEWALDDDITLED